MNCYAPFGYLLVHINGEVTPCCFVTGLGSFGNLNNNTFDEVWNSDSFVRLREGIADGTSIKTYCRDCILLKCGDPVIMRNKESKSEEYNKNYAENIAEYENLHPRLNSKPLFYSLTYSYKCNLKCIMCWEADKPIYEDISDKVLDELNRHFGYAHTISLVGGEPFMIKKIIDFIGGDKTDFYITITTNGTLINDNYLNQLTRFRFVNIVFSVDAATKETYERIRVNAKWEDVYENLKKASNKDKYKNFQVSINYVVMLSNFYEIPLAIKMANDLDINISFSPINGIKHTNENIFQYKELLNIIPKWREVLDEALLLADGNKNKAVVENIKNRINYFKKELDVSITPTLKGRGLSREA